MQLREDEVAGASPLLQLRRLRDEIRRIDALVEDRDKLIREAAEQHSQRQIAKAAGLSKSRIQQIVSSD